MRHIYENVISIEKSFYANSIGKSLGDYDITSYLFEAESYNDYTGDM